MAKNKTKSLEEITIDGKKYKVELPVAQYLQNASQEKHNLAMLLANYYKLTENMFAVGKSVADFMDKQAEENEASSNDSKS
jgi:hypothetical protein